jgi:hypothetical protein
MLKFLAGACAGFFVLSAAGSANAGAACTPTGYMQNGTNLTAALVNPRRVYGQDVDATGCDIGVYYGPGATGGIQGGSNIHGARYFGVLMNGGKAPILNSVIHDIGDGNAGVGIGCAIDSPQASGGLIRGNTIYNYMKNGIDLRGPNCGGTAGNPIRITTNQITGKGPIDQLAQNGIVAGLGATNLIISNNNISGHSFTGLSAASGAGINILGGPCYGTAYATNTTVTRNNLVGNDVGIFLLNYNSACTASPAAASPNNTVSNNNMFNFVVVNTSGNGTGPYQVGISITDTRTKVADNSICGRGYDNANPPAGSLVDMLDPAGSSKLELTHNKCFNGPNKLASLAMVVQDSVSKSAAPSKKRIQASP